jgi:porin
MKTLLVSTMAIVIAATMSLVVADPADPVNIPPTPKSGSGEWSKGDYLTGNWGGLRDRLESDGLHFFGFYTMDPAGNVSGGKRQGATYVDDWYFGATFDLDKLIGWTGGKFTVSGINRDGPSLTNDYIGSQFNAQQCYGGQNVFLYGVFLEQKLLDDKVILKLGRFSSSDDFNASPLYGYSMNNAINGDIRAVLFDTQFSAYPFSTWAASLRVNPTPQTYAQLGVFQNSDRLFSPSLNGVNWDIRDEDGVFIIGQVGWTPEFCKQVVQSATDGKTGREPELKGLPGHYWVGGSVSTWEYPQFGTVVKATDSYGFYVHADQMVYQETPGSDQGLTAFSTYCLYPQQNISIMPWQVTLGLNYKGLFPGRDDDHTMLHVSYGEFSSDYADTVEAAGNGRPQYEMLVEMGHRFAVTKFAYFQPDIQWIINPSGTHRIENAVVIGAQIGVIF